MDKTTIGIDPVCSMRVYEADALKVEVRGEIRWFCSEDCARRFSATPWRFEDEEYNDRNVPHVPVVPA